MTNRSRLIEAAARALWTPWERASEGEKEDARLTATAVIDALADELGEPTAEMVEAGRKVLESELGVSSGYREARAVYTAMLAKAFERK